MCTSFKKELMEAKHNFLLSGGSTFQIALYTDSASFILFSQGLLVSLPGFNLTGQNTYDNTYLYLFSKHPFTSDRELGIKD